MAVRLFTCAFAAALAPLPALAQDEVLSPPESAESSPSGGDLTRPLRRIDLRAGFDEAGDEETFTFTLRHDRPVPLDNGWQANLRIDLPFVFAGQTGPANAGAGTEAGLGEVLLHAALTRRVNEAEGFGFGAQLIMPTASSDQLGRGQWRLRPIIGYRWFVPEITEGSFFQFAARYDVSIAGDGSRADTSELQLSPNLEIALPGRSYLSIFPSYDVRYNFVRDEFFVPLNLEVGKEWNRIVFSLEGAVGVIKGDRPPYDWKMEARVGFRF